MSEVRMSTARLPVPVPVEGQTRYRNRVRWYQQHYNIEDGIVPLFCCHERDPNMAKLNEPFEDSKKDMDSD